jgi:signal transduction histidine kinase/ABC-type amino acid transport substrate-binding protein
MNRLTKKIVFIKQILLYACIFSLLILKTSAQTQLPDTLVFGSDANFPPFEYIAEEGYPTGFNIDIIKAIAQKEGFNIKIKLGVWSDIKREFEEAGTIHISDMFYTKERDSIVDYAIPHMVTYDEIYIRKGTKGIYTLEDLAGKRVAVLNASTIQEFLSENYPSIKLVPSKDEPYALRLLIEKKVDAALLSHIIDKESIKEYTDSVIIVGKVFPREYSFVVKEGNQLLLNKINRGIIQLKESGEFDRIYKRWFPLTISSWFYKNRYIIALIVFASISTVLFFIILLQNLVKHRTKELEFYNSRLKLISSLNVARIGKQSAIEQTYEMIQKFKSAFNIDSVVVRVLENNKLKVFTKYNLTDEIPEEIDIKNYAVNDILVLKNPISFTKKQLKEKGITPTGYSIDDLKFENFAIIPLLADERVIGTLEVCSKNPKWHFTTIDLEHLQIVAGHIAISIENIRLFEENEKQKERLLEQIAVREKIEKEIKELNQQLEQRILERTAELQQANRELEEFAYSISHDLKAPLRSILGFSEIIANRYKDSLNSEALKYFNYIIVASNNMTNLINDLLRFARLSKNEIMKQKIDLNIVIETVLKDLETDIKKKNAQIVVENNLHAVNADTSLLKQIFLNLIINAITYNREGEAPIVTISAKEEVDSIIISINDNGVGIPTEYHEKIFNIFQRLHSQSEFPGTGIGLAIVKKAVAKLGGKIWLESEVGKGTTFYISFPKV